MGVFRPCGDTPRVHFAPPCPTADRRLQPAENAVLAPIMLYGPPEQQHLARAFVSTKFNKDTPEACDALVAKLKETVKQDDEGTWVRTFALVLVQIF